MTPNARLAAAVLGHLEGLGVEDFVVCAGARNAPLVTSLLAARKEKTRRLRHHFDERTAAFFALGLAKRKGRPVAVLTTSGTAAAELLPAAVEAYYSGIPLILVTADRPKRFRGSGAPQAIEQAGLFGLFAPLSIDVESEIDLGSVGQWHRDEPLHLNVCFEEPAANDGVGRWEAVPFHEPVPEPGDRAAAELERFCREAGRLVVLLGELDESWRRPVEAFLKTSGIPAWAEATSGLRESAVLAGQLVRSEKGLAALEPTRILRIGGVPSLRFWRDLETLEAIEVLSVTRRNFTGLARPSEKIATAAFPQADEPIQQDWSGEPTLSSERSVLESSELERVRELSRHIPPEALVFLGNSLPIREWNEAASLDPPHPRCFASRGANGIDGQVATFLGLSEGEPEAWGIFGDLTALYDLNAPALLGQSPEGKRRMVVLNNGGGRIFSRLPSLSSVSDQEKIVTENRHSWRFENWAAMWGMEYVLWRTGDDFPSTEARHAVIEIPIEEKP
ncbi:MAG: 2-succinyl-5-enolpyruvyl-6-hydroxy-3-cyclohexene-1-carboxylic-acid synthase [Verrucomicrobiales bacterium]